MTTTASRNAQGAPVCRDCRHCEHDRRVMEAAIPGLGSFGSAYGASIGDSRLCRLRDQLVSPRDSCPQFDAHGAVQPGTGIACRR
jgi:hypothetical protein